MKNRFKDYFEKKNKDEWHSYEIGEYHISDIGINHKDLESDRHYGPCLRNTFWQYIDGCDFSIISQGNFKLGNLIHEEVQKIREHNQPLTISEFPIKLYIPIKNDKVAIMGKADLVEFIVKPEKIVLRVTDIKTASVFTMPTSPYEFNPTYIAQIYLYTYILLNYYFRPELIDEIEMQMLYVKKSNATVHIQEKIYDMKVAKKIFDEFISRVKKIHQNLLNGELPDPEPMKWCKYCTNLKKCLKKGGIKYDKEEKRYNLKNDED